MNLPMTPDDRELIQQLLDDVGILEDQFRIGLPKPSATRTIFAPILRRWIAEGLFFTAQKLILPDQVAFPVPSHAHAIRLCKAGVYEYWMGLVMFGTLGVATGKVAEQHRGPNGMPKTQLADGKDYQAAPQKASTFFHQRMFFWKGRFYMREDVIKMHANALGGVHLDFRRTRDEADINEIKHFFGFELKGNLKQMLMGDEISVGRADPTRRQQVYDATELIAMDTARIFASGIRASEQAFLTQLA
jgi:hypothetical protein